MLEQTAVLFVIDTGIFFCLLWVPLGSIIKQCRMLIYNYVWSIILLEPIQMSHKAGYS